MSFGVKEGREVVSCKYHGVSVCSEGFVTVCKQEKSAVFGKDGVRKTDFIFDSVSTFHNGRAIFSRDGKMGFIDRNGRVIVPIVYDNVFRYHGKTEKTILFSGEEKNTC